jgi:hypothetical protein
MPLRVDFCSRWDSPTLLEYNRYYLLGLDDVVHLTSSAHPRYLAPIRSVASRAHAARVLMRRVFERIGTRYPHDPRNFVGRYAFDTGTRRVRVAIDPHDNRKIASQAALDWCDVYFKANKWVSEKYPAKVLPIVNGNGVHSTGTLEFLRTLRGAPKDYDLVFISRLGAGIEHNIRLFESLARLPGRKRLVAILYPQFGQQQYAAALERAGVTCLTRNIEPLDLWTTLARARVNFLRLGAKFCIPWRMIDFLAMGSAIVIDRHPFSDWPVPLEDGVNFAACFGRSAEPAVDEDYSRVAATVQRVFDSPSMIEEMAERNAEYFDQFASPPMVARYTIDSALAFDPQAPRDSSWSEGAAPWPEAVGS